MKVILTILLLSVVANSYAQVDSLNDFQGKCWQDCQQDSLGYYEDATHCFKVAQLVAPVACIGLGVFATGNDWLENQSHDIRKKLQENVKRKITIDNYTQFAPSLAVYALNLCGVKGKHDFKDRTMLWAMSWLTMSVVTTGLKYAYGERRPDGSTRNSFPSGHTATAFMGAEFLYQEYKDASPLLAIAGYTVALGTGFFRMYNNRHWLNDVIAGAGIGMLSTKVSYWIYPKLFKKSDCARNIRKAHFMAMPYYADKKVGCAGAFIF